MYIYTMYLLVSFESAPAPSHPHPNCWSSTETFPSTCLSRYFQVHSYSFMCRIRSDNGSHALPSGATKGRLLYIPRKQVGGKIFNPKKPTITI